MKQAVILAAGEGIRLRPFTVNRPNAMLFIAGKPLIQFVIESLAAHNIRDIILIVGYHKEKIYDYVGNGNQFGVEVKYITQTKQLGTAHALAQAKGSTDDEFLVLPGNKLIAPETIRDFIEAGPPSLLIKKVENPSQYGVVTLKDGKLVKIVEKPPHPESDYVNAGIYSFKKEIFQYIEPELGIPEAINLMLAQGQSIKVVTTDKMWLDVIYPWDILKLTSVVLKYLRGRQSGTIEPGVSLRGLVSIGEETVVHSNSYIAGPVIIGKGCEIGPNVCIFPATSIGDNVIIAPFTEIRNTVIEDDVHIGSGSFMEDSVIDNGCIIGPHFSACSGEAEVKINEEYQTIKMGAMLGQSCHTGSNITAEAGSIIGNYAQIKSLKVVNGRIPDRSLVI